MATAMPSVAVVGGSQAGMMAAIALRDIGCDVDVYERSSRPLKDRGAGINLHRALTDLLEQRAGLSVERLSCRVSRQQYLGPCDEILYSEPLAMTYSSWNALFALLRSALGETPYHLDAAVTRVAVSDASATLTFADGRSETRDLVVFADGISSTGRHALIGDQQPTYAGYVVWRGCIWEDEVEDRHRALFEGAHTTCLLDESHMNVYLVPASGDAVAEERRLFNFVWYQNVLLGDELDRLTIDRDGLRRTISVPPGLVAGHLAEELRRRAINELPPAAAELVTKTAEPFLQVIYDHEVDRMAYGRACLIGDAAFIARPHLGAGTAKAAENAFGLARTLSASGGDVLAALAAWEGPELDLGRTVVQRSRDLGERLQRGEIIPGDPTYSATVRAPLRSMDAQPAIRR